MRNQKGRIILFACIILMLITGCQPQDDRENMKEALSSLQFTYEKNILGDYHVATISTEERSFVWRLADIEFVKTEDTTNTVTYELDENGAVQNGKIYLNADGLKKYSKAYSLKYGKSLKIIDEK